MATTLQSPMTLDEFIEEMEKAELLHETLPIARDLAEQVTQIYYEDIAINFALSSSADGQGWAPHAPSTISRYGPHPLLILTGALLEASTSSIAPGSYLEVSDRQIVIGNTLIYAATQQYGRDNIPARPYFDPSEESIERVEDAAYDYLVREVFA